MYRHRIKLLKACILYTNANVTIISYLVRVEVSSISRRHSLQHEDYQSSL